MYFSPIPTIAKQTMNAIDIYLLMLDKIIFFLLIE